MHNSHILVLMHNNLMEVIMQEYYRNNLIELALLQLEKKYTWDTKGPEEFDCSGLTYFIYKEMFNIDINKDGYGVGDTTKQITNNIGFLKKYQENDSNKQEYIKYIKPGDLIFFHTQSLEENIPTPTNRYPGHVGIYLGNDQFIHASSKAGKIIISTLSDKWIKKLIASKDIISDIIK